MAEVYLSPSPRHFNEGYGTYGTEEARMNLIADVVELELARNGLDTARNNPAYDLQTAVAEANAQGTDAYVAIRSQAGLSTDQGSAVYYFRPNTDSQRLAEDIYAALSALTPWQDRGTYEGASAYGGQGYYELRRTRMPAAIVEVGFHNNPQEADYILTHVYEIGVAIARGILNYFSLPYTPDSPQEEIRLKNEYNNVYL